MTSLEILAGGAIGTFVKLPSIEVVEIAALAGLDFVVVDLEHSPLSIETAATLIAVARARGLGVLVRIPDHSASWVQRCLDAGADGLMVPHVDSVQQARELHTTAHFPPHGTRGCGPTTRAGGWGLRSMNDYLASETLLLGQVESQAGVDASEVIVAEKLVSSLFLGPADLALSLGVEADSPDLAAMIRRVRETGASRGVPVGIAAPTAAAAGRRIDEGFDYVVVSNDATLLGTALRDVVADARSRR